MQIFEIFDAGSFFSFWVAGIARVSLISWKVSIYYSDRPAVELRSTAGVGQVSFDMSYLPIYLI